jgi:hypothetical protein
VPNNTLKYKNLAAFIYKLFSMAQIPLSQSQAAYLRQQERDVAEKSSTFEHCKTNRKAIK